MAGEIMYNSFKKSRVVFMPNIISLQIMLLPILSPNIHIQILQTDLHTFPYRITAFSIRWSFYLFS